MTIAFAVVVGLLVEGEPLDGDISGKLTSRVKSGKLPFHALTSGKLQALTGAQTGLGGIPRRFLDGLENSEELLELAYLLAGQVTDKAGAAESESNGGKVNDCQADVRN